MIGNNIANANTFGAKSSRAEFADVYANALNGAAATPSASASPSPRWRSSSRRATSRPPRTRWTWRINGNGFFQVTDGNSPVTYTRNGQFKIDRDGYIVNNQLQRLMGYPADGDRRDPARRGARAAAADRAASPRRSTTDDRHGAEPRRARRDHRAGRRRADRLHRPETYNNATSLTVYDARGQDVALTYYFQKAADRHLERLRHRQRHADRGTAGGNRRRRRRSRSRPTAARRPRRSARSPSTSRRRPTPSARARCRSPASSSTSPAPRSTARRSA